jgi:hypothetical protein
MFIGHFGAGLAAKSITPRPSLGTLFLASQFIDLIWPVFLIIGAERVELDPGNTVVTPLNFVSYPLSHSALAVLGWSVLVGIAYYAFRRQRKDSLVLGALVMSHWVLDLLSHRPDLPVVPWGDLKLGMGLWNSLPLTIVVEGALFVLGVVLYLKTTRARDAKGSFGFWGLVVFLVVMYLMNLFGPPPPSVEPIGYVGLLQWLLIAWAYWVDRHRGPVVKSVT